MKFLPNWTVSMSWPTYPRPLTLVAIAIGCILGMAVLTIPPSILIVVMAVLVIVTLSFRFPFFSVVIYLLIWIVQPEQLHLFPVTLRVQLIWAFFCLLSVFVFPLLLTTHIELQRPWLRIDNAVAVLLIAVFLSIPLAVSRLEAFNGWWEFVKVVYAYLLIRYVTTSVTRLHRMVWTLFLACALLAVLSLAAWLSGNVYVGEGGITRVKGVTSTVGDPDSLANMLVAMIPLLFLLISVEPRRIAKLVLLILAALSLYLTAFTGTRSAALSLGATLFLIILSSKRKLLILGIVMLSMLGMWAVLPSNLKERYASVLNYRHEVTYQRRQELAHAGLRMFLNHPVTGVGISCFQIAQAEEFHGPWIQPHNVYAQIASEMGLLGLCAFAWFIITAIGTWREIRRSVSETTLSLSERQWLKQLAQGIAIMFATLLVQGFASHNFYRWQYYAGAALLAACLETIKAAGVKESSNRSVEQSSRPVGLSLPMR